MNRSAFDCPFDADTYRYKLQRILEENERQMAQVKTVGKDKAAAKQPKPTTTAGKAPAKSGVSKKAPAKEKKPAPTPPPAVEEDDPESLDHAVSLLMNKINESKYASPRVKRSESVELYRTIAEQCNDAAESIESEMDGDDDEDEDAPLSGEDGDFDTDDK